MEGTEAANVSASGMGRLRLLFLQLCGAGDHIVSSPDNYGGTYAFLKNFTTRLGIETTFVDITKLEVVEAAITAKTKVLYCETVSNPLLEVADIAGLSAIAKKAQFDFGGGQYFFATFGFSCPFGSRYCDS